MMISCFRCELVTVYTAEMYWVAMTGVQLKLNFLSEANEERKLRYTFGLILVRMITFSVVDHLLGSLL